MDDKTLTAAELAAIAPYAYSKVVAHHGARRLVIAAKGIEKTRGAGRYAVQTQDEALGPWRVVRWTSDPETALRALRGED